jgi:hypothetical protein
LKWAVLACALPGVALAELPPQYQRQAELVKIIADGAVDAALGGEPIEMIRMTRPDIYVVRSAGCKVTVAIVGVPLPDGMVGARDFTVAVQNTTC